jgi:hypothetical protein
MRQILSTAIVAVVVSVLTLTIADAMARSDPARDAVTPALVRGQNADMVDGKHAIRATMSLAPRAKKLVATDKKGFLPANIVRPLWRLVQGVPAVLADGQVAWGEVAGKPDGFADNVDNAGVTAVTVTRVESAPVSIPAGGNDFVKVACPPGTAVIGGGGHNTFFADLVDSYSDGNAWQAYYDNDTGSTVTVWAVAHCLSVQPTDRLELAGKRRALGPASKHK